MRFGLRGALRLQPLFMMDTVQWSSHASVLRGLHLYRPFGSWARTLGRARRRRVPMIVTDAELAAMRQRRALAKANAVRQDDAEARRPGLLVLAHPLWLQVRSSRGPRRGRPALREPLRALLVQQGVEISANDLDWLVALLNREDKAAGQAAKAPAASA